MIGCRWLLLVLLSAPALSAGESLHLQRLDADGNARPGSAHSVIIYVVRRRWHIDIGFAATDLMPPLNKLAAEFPGVQYLFFGFGDQQYLLAKNHNAPVLLRALWPGPGMVLATGLTAPPQAAFGEAGVAALAVTPQQLNAAQAFIWKSLDPQKGTRSASRGPYDGSLYFAAAPKYSAFYTCNTWAAQALKSAALPVHSGGVLFAGQLWKQVRRVARRQATTPALPPTSGVVQLQGGFDPSWQMTVVPEF